MYVLSEKLKIGECVQIPSAPFPFDLAWFEVVKIVDTRIELRLIQKGEALFDKLHHGKHKA